jgi:hypothetical protein
MLDIRPKLRQDLGLFEREYISIKCETEMANEQLAMLKGCD